MDRVDHFKRNLTGHNIGPKKITQITLLGIITVAFLTTQSGGNNNNVISTTQAQTFGNLTFNENNNNNNIVTATNGSSVQSNNVNLVDLYEKARKSLVEVHAGRSLGSGFVIDNQGHVITNHHVVFDEQSQRIARFVDIVLWDGIAYKAQVIGADPLADLAVLTLQNVPNGKLFPITLADSSNLRVGEQVVALGSPVGLTGSMSRGIVSAIGRLSQEVERASTFSIAPPLPCGVVTNPDLIQTDAAIFHGNSGGPLVNMKGEVVGVNELGVGFPFPVWAGQPPNLRPTNAFAMGSIAGLNFAIPSNTVKKIASSFITKGSFEHPWLGVQGVAVSTGIAERLGIKEPRGFLVVDVLPQSPAAKAGVRGAAANMLTRIDGIPVRLGGDVIVQIDNQTVRNINDLLVYVMREKEVGDSVVLSVIRNGQSEKINLTLEPLPQRYIASIVGNMGPCAGFGGGGGGPS